MKLSKEQKFDIVYYFVISFFTLFSVLNAQLGDIDELWNFIEARNISLGLFPYRDFNIVATPLSMFVNSIALLIKPTLLSFRILYFIYYLIIFLSFR